MGGYFVCQYCGAHLHDSKVEGLYQWEEKAQRYDEALQKAKQRLDCDKNGFISTNKALLLSMFPELKESKGERIRKDLIQWIDDFPDIIWNGHNKKDIIAWLNKQGEQKTVDKVETKFYKGE